MSLPSFSVDNRILVNLVFLFCTLVGVLALSKSVVDVYPDVSFDAGQIIVTWPGASPEEVEASITRKIEDEIQDVRGIDRIVSTSERDLAMIDVKFREDLSENEFNRAFEELRAEVQRVTDLPSDAERPEVRKISVNELYPLLQVVVVGNEDVPPIAVRETAARLRERLRQVEGIMRVSDIGIPDLEWRVFVDREAMEAAGLDLLYIADAVRARHRNIPAGTLQGSLGEYALTATGEVTSPEALLDIVLAWSEEGSPLHLRDVATVVPGFEKLTHLNRYNGRPCINLSVAKSEGSDSMDVRRRIGMALEEFERTESLPPGIDLGISIDITRILESRINVLVNSLVFGVVLVFLILWTFVGARNGLLALLGIPFSFLVAFAVLSQFGITINVITLFSLMLVSGMVVDDALIVLENIYRHVELKKPLREAVIRGTSEVVWPVIAASLTSVAAFLPMLLMTGVTGEFMSIIPKTVAVVLLASILECLVLLPAHYMHVGSRKPLGGIPRRANAGLARVGDLYGRVLERTLQRPWLIVGTVLTLAVGALFVWRSLPVELFPSDFQAFYCNVHADPSYSLETTADAVAEIEALLQELMPEKVEAVTTSIGAALNDDNQLVLKPSVAQILVFANEEWTSKHNADDLIRNVRQRVEPLVRGEGRHRFMRIKVDTFQDGPPVGKPVAVRVAAPDYGTGKSIAREIAAYLQALPGVFGVSDNLDEGPREVHVVPDPVELARAGVPFSEIGRLVLAANEGLEVGDLVPPGSRDEVTIRVQLAEKDRRDPAALMLLKVRNANGGLVTLADVARQEVRRGPSSLYHYDGERVVLVTADVDERVTDSGTVNRALIERFSDIQRSQPDVSLAFGGEFEETQRSFQSLRQAFLVAVILIYIILAAQFRSYALPLAVMTVVPFSYVGVVLGLWIMGFPFTIITFIAIIGLSGVVVNDSIVLVDFIHAAALRGEGLLPAVIAGCRTRLRAIFLTTSTTVLGLLPMALGIPDHSKIWSPFAATIAFGLSLAMFLTLFLVPAVYTIIGRAAERRPARPAG